MSRIVFNVCGAVAMMGVSVSVAKAMPTYPSAVYHDPYNASYTAPYARSQPLSFSPAKKSGFGEWRNWMQNQLNGRQWRSGDGNIFEDAKGFYRWMGNGNTRYKFYFDVDFQLEMDAWLKGQNRSRHHGQHQQRYLPYWQNQWQGQPQGYRAFPPSYVVPASPYRVR